MATLLIQDHKKVKFSGRDISSLTVKRANWNLLKHSAEEKINPVKYKPYLTSTLSSKPPGVPAGRVRLLMISNIPRKESSTCELCIRSSISDTVYG